MKKIASLLIVISILCISSYAVFASGVTFYQDIQLSGPSTNDIPVGTWYLSDLQSKFGFQNDWASSVSISPGYKVDLYSDDKLGGTHWMLDQNDFNSRDFTNFGANDAVSSVKVSRK